MANPNKTAWHAAHRKWVTVWEQTFHSQSDATAEADKRLAELGAGHRKSVKPFKIGPRPCSRNDWKQAYQYVARIYRTELKETL